MKILTANKRTDRRMNGEIERIFLSRSFELRKMLSWQKRKNTTDQKMDRDN